MTMVGRPTPTDHPWKRKTNRIVHRFERQREAAQEVTLENLVTFGVPVGELVGNEEVLSELDRFEADHGLELAGVDVVLEEFSRARYDHEEYGCGDDALLAEMGEK